MLLLLLYAHFWVPLYTVHIFFSFIVALCFVLLSLCLSLSLASRPSALCGEWRHVLTAGPHWHLHRPPQLFTYWDPYNLRQAHQTGLRGESIDGSVETKGCQTSSWRSYVWAPGQPLSVCCFSPSGVLGTTNNTNPDWFWPLHFTSWHLPFCYSVHVMLNFCHCSSSNQWPWTTGLVLIYRRVILKLAKISFMIGWFISAKSLRGGALGFSQ